MERLDKLLSSTGRWSRREVKQLVKEGRVLVDGVPAAGPEQKLDRERACVQVDGEALELREFTYVMLYKPAGVLSATEDARQRTVLDLLPPALRRQGLSPVGRLDKDSEGLLLLTNDGQFANLIMHPSHHIGKTYRVTVRPGITEEQCTALAAGVDIGEEGEPEITAPATVLVLEKYPDRAVVQITIAQGKNRQVRRMCEAVGLTVARLKRTAIGPLRLGMLKPGDWRELKKSELIALRNAGGGAAAPQPPQPKKPGTQAKKPKAPAGSRPKEQPRPGPKAAKGAPKAPRPAARGDAGDGMRRDRSGGLRFAAPDKPARRGGQKGGPKR